jgi:hypothetical protein
MSFRTQNPCKVYPELSQADCPECCNKRCHDCGDPVELYWQAFCSNCFRDPDNRKVIDRARQAYKDSLADPYRVEPVLPVKPLPSARYKRR